MISVDCNWDFSCVPLIFSVVQTIDANARRVRICMVGESEYARFYSRENRPSFREVYGRAFRIA